MPIPSVEPADDLLGRWDRDQACLELVDAYERAGLASFIGSSLVGIGFLEVAPDDPENPCLHAKTVHRSLAFSVDGSYAGLDPSGTPVDGGRYRITSPGKVELSEETERTSLSYSVDGDSLTFELVWPVPCETIECLDHMAWATETFTLGPWAAHASR